MGPFEMVVAIVIVATIGSIVKAKMGVRKDKWGNETQVGPSANSAENARLRDEVKMLKERVQVLERVVTDNEGSLRLDREIERLRDPNRN